MAANSSFLSRFSLSRDASPVLPLHADAHHQPSDYDLDELSPRPEQSLLFSATDPEPAFLPGARPSKAGNNSVAFAYQDNPSASYRASGLQQRYSYQPSPPPSSGGRQPPVLFAGPPPPIAKSMLLYHDTEDRNGSGLEYSRGWRGGHSGASSPGRPLARTVLLEPRKPQPGGGQRGSKVGPLDDSTWSALQRRERALQSEIQTLLDVQSAGLSAGLGRGPLNPSPSIGQSSDGGYGGSDDGRSQNPAVGSRSRGNTPTANSTSYAASYSASGAASAVGRSVRLPADRSTATGSIIPVRQPRPRRLGLRAARAGLARSISLLANLKTEEDASLAAALQSRKRALVHLRRLAGRRENIARELQALEVDDEEPLTRELTTLQTAHASTNQQITELEAQLAMLRQRKRTLERRIEDAISQREAGLSGYRGALKEVEAQLTAVLRRPPIQPLDVDALGYSRTKREEGHAREIRLNDGEGSMDNNGGGDDGYGSSDDASVGVEFLRLLPERRTAEMARSWWEHEIRLLERRRNEVSKEREALEGGSAVWLASVQLVSDFEAGLRKDMTPSRDGDVADEDADEDESGRPASSKGKEKVVTVEERMRAQLAKMNTVITGLQTHLHTAENKSWNLLICAIGAELEAFREAYAMLRQALPETGHQIDDLEDDNNHDSSRANVTERGNIAESGSTSSDLIPTSDPVDGLSKTIQGLGMDEFEDNSATPRLARSTSSALPTVAKATHGSVGGNLHDRGHHMPTESDDNGVPPELLVHHGEEYNGHGGYAPSIESRRQGRRQDRQHDPHHDKDDSSENEVPLEFLSEQQIEDD